MKHLARSHWQDLIRQQSKSQLTIAEFCKQLQLNNSSFYKHKAKPEKANVKTTSHFVKVKPALSPRPVTGSIKIQHHQTHIDLPMTITPTWLAELVKALA